MPLRCRLALTVLALACIGASQAPPPQPWPEAHPPIGHQPRRPPGYRPFHYPKTPSELWREEGAVLHARARLAMQDITRVIATGPYRADRASLGNHPCPEWFVDAKFGMFIDWGPWAVAGWAPQADKATYPDWYEQRLFKEFRDYHVKTWGADVGPDDLIQLLRDDAFQPAQLVALARSAGMRYVVPFLKHHGGYALWDSSYTHRDSLEWGLRRDIAREFSDAAHVAGLRYGAYVSLGEWSYPVVIDGDLRILQFDGTSTTPLTSDTPFLSGKVPVASYTDDYLVPAIAELIERTNPDVLWFDGEWESAPRVWRSPDLAAYFYNRAAVRGQEVAVNDRFGKDTRGATGWGDFFTSEYHVIEGFQPHPWEENRSLSHSYGYNWEESFDDRYVLSEADALDLLLRVVANGGNLLLMISPDGSGRVPANQVRRLEFMGRWLARYGEAVYATRAVGLARQPPWGYVTRSKDGHALYAVITRWPAEARIVLPVPARVEGAQMLRGPAVPARSIDGGIAVDLSRTTAIDPYASVVRVSILQGQDAPLP